VKPKSDLEWRDIKLCSSSWKQGNTNKNKQIKLQSYKFQGGRISVLNSDEEQKEADAGK
ncbi:hypothetical protein PIB30_045430, partial [Stylosanthes scabra]|nr:hypothetical protein [Stylosanthes scabra]